MKKLIVTLLACVLSVPLLTACPESTKQDEVVLDIFAPGHYPAGEVCTSTARMWMVKVKYSPKGTIIHRCVSRQVAEKQVRNTFFRP